MRYEHLGQCYTPAHNLLNKVIILKADLEIKQVIKLGSYFLFLMILEQENRVHQMYKHGRHAVIMITWQ